MPKLFEILERNGLVSEPDIPKLADLKSHDLRKLHETLYTEIYETQLKEHRPAPAQSPDPFTFFAGPSLRGDSMCEQMHCRAQKLEVLARYAALYANSVTMPLRLTAPDRAKSIRECRRSLALNIFSLLRLRPLITAGIVKPAVLRTMHCEHTIEWAKTLIEVVHTVAAHMALAESSKFEAVYQLPEKSPTGRSTVYLDGPPEFVDHGELVQLFDEGPNWRRKSWRF